MEGRSVETTVFSIIAGSLAKEDVGRNC